MSKISYLTSKGTLRCVFVCVCTWGNVHEIHIYFANWHRHNPLCILLPKQVLNLKAVSMRAGKPFIGEKNAIGAMTQAIS